MSDISNWLNDRVYPAIFERADEIFPEHDFKQYRNDWRSQTYLNGSPHESRPDKTVITARAPYCILEQGGDVKNFYDYIKDRDGLDDKQTLETLSQLSGVPLPKWDHTHDVNYQVKKTRDQIMEDAQGYFTYCLESSAGSKKTRDYLQTVRGYSEIDIKAMGLGFIPSQNRLLKYLTDKKKHIIEEVNKAINLPKAIGETHILTIPFREPSGQIRGFSARTIKPEIKPPYYNSKNLEKKDILFNLKAIKGDKDLTIVEGQLDALNSEVKGLDNVVALGGKDINSTQLKEAIRRGARKLTLCLDNDKAGEEATLRALDLINKQTDLPVFVASLPEGVKDPDQLIREKGAEALQKALNKAVKSYVYKLNHILEKYLQRMEESGATEKALEDFTKEVTITAQNIKNRIDQDLFINYFLERVTDFKISKESLQAEVDKLQYKEDIKTQKKGCDRILKEGDRLNKKGETNEALALIGEQSKELLQKDKEVEYSRLLVPLKEDEIRNRQANRSEDIKAGYKIYMPEKKDNYEDLLLPAGALSIFAAPTSHGKSTMLINIFLNTVLKYPDKKFYLFSFEEDGDSVFFNIMNTYIAEDLCRDNRRCIRSYYKYGNDKQFLDTLILTFHTGREQFFRELVDTGRVNIHYLDYSSEALIEAIRYLHKHSNIGGVFIDYIQLLRKAEGKWFTRHEELKQICLDLKNLAVETGLPIVLGAQFNNQVTNHIHLLSINIGEAGDISRLASLIIGMWNNHFTPLGKPGELNDIDRKEMKVDDTIYVKILKNRGGRIGIDGLLYFDGNTGKISNDQMNIF